MFKNFLVIIVLPLVLMYFIGVYCLQHPLWFAVLDYSNPIIQYFMSHVAFCTVGMSACLKFMWDKRKKK